MHHHLPCIILQDLDISRPGFQYVFSQSELRNSSRERLETVGQLLCTGACTSALQGRGLYSPCGSWIPWPMFQAIFARCNVLQTQSARGCKKQTHQQDTDLAGLVNWLGDECCIILSKNVKDEFAKLELFVLNRCLNSNRSPRPFEAPSHGGRPMNSYQIPGSLLH